MPAPKTHAIALLLLTAGATVTTSTPRAHAADPAKCSASYEAGQEQRRKGELVRARANLLVCVSGVCPAALSKDCVGWLREVEALLPSVLIEVRDVGGALVPDARVTIDDAPAQPGTSTALDPGSHRLRAEADGRSPATQTIDVAAGEKDRRVVVVLPALAAPPPPPPGPVLRTSRPVPVASWVLGGVSVVGLGGFGYFAASGASEAKHLRETCAPRCTDEQVDVVQRRFLIGDVSLGVSIVALGAAVWLYATRPELRARSEAGLLDGRGGAW